MNPPGSKEVKAMMGRKQLACSFCGKAAGDVAKLVAGPGVYICDECVALASRIMKRDESPQPGSHPDHVTRLQQEKHHHDAP